MGLIRLFMAYPSPSLNISDNGLSAIIDRDMPDAGKSLPVMTAELNEEMESTAGGGDWHLTSVKRLVDRIAA